MANRVVEELIRKAKATSISNRGKYPVTIASNVYKQNGTALENKKFPEADVVVNPEEAPVSEVIATVEPGAVIAIDGIVAEELTLDKGLVIQGANAGIPQNHPQAF